MAAGQQKKRLHASSVVSCNLQEQYREKKKKYVESSQNPLDLRSHISLEWDNNQKRAVAKREQLGITWRHLAPFIDSDSCCHRSLADVFAIPQEIFELEGINEVLSYEVWETHLSEEERNLLSQFLPKGNDAEQTVKSLLMGENLHFGNPFLNWGASLCSGNLHPDVVLCQEKYFWANKKAYYSELQKYHNDMVENLRKWKERWASCKDPEKDIVQNIWRKGFMKDKDNERPEEAASSRKEEKQHKLYIHSGDSAKYMSYFKISRKQHQLVKRIKQSGDGIQSKSLNRILGDIKSFHVQPYGVFEEEERKKLHESWLQLAKRDLPKAFATWTERQLQRQQWRNSLEQEMTERKEPVVDKDEGKVNPDSWFQEDRDDRETDHEDTMEITNYKYDEELIPHSTCSHHLQRVPSLNGHYKIEPLQMESEGGNQDFVKPGAATTVISEFLGNLSPTEDAVEQVLSASSAKDSFPHSTSSQSLQQSPSFNGHQEIDPINMEEEGGQTIRPEGSAPTLSEFLRSTYLKEDDVEQEVLIPSAKDVWPAVSMPDSYYHPMPVSCGYTSDRSTGQPQTIEGETHMVDLETDMLQQDAGDHLLHRPSNMMGSAFNINNNGSFFTCSSQNHNEPQPFLKGQGMLSSYPSEHKQPGLHILGTGNGSPEAFHPGNFREQQLQLVEQMRDRDFDMDQVIQKNVYSNGGRYPNPSQEHFLPVSMQDWSINPVHVSAPFQSPLNGSSFLGQNWFPGVNRARGSWSAMDITGNPGMCLGNGSSADEGLYSVLPQCNKLQSPSDSMRASQQYIPARNIFSGDIPRNSETAHQLNLSGCDAAVAPALKANNMSWMNMPRQNSNLHDSIGKPFLRSWNQ